MVQVRPAVAADADAVGQVHVRAWQRAYRGQLPDEYLDGLRPEDRARMWARALEREGNGTLLVAERGALVGFVFAGPAAGEPEEGTGEVFALNVDPDHWGSGAGRALLVEAERWLAGTPFGAAILWVHPANERARRFYERAGWRDDAAERVTEVLGVTVPEVRYRRDLGPDPSTGQASG